MKNRTLMILSFCLLLFSAGCKEEDESVMEAELSSECTFEVRSTTDTYVNEQGVITYMQELNLYTITGGRMDNGRVLDKLVPCNLPYAFRKDKLKVVFSGELKEIYEYEDWGAHPFKLTKLKTIVD